MAKITREALGLGPRPKQSRLRVPRIIRQAPRSVLHWSRFIAAIVAVYALDSSEPLFRHVAVLVLVVGAWYVGWLDGRRDLAVSVLTDRRDDRPAQRPPQRGEEPEP